MRLSLAPILCGILTVRPIRLGRISPHTFADEIFPRTPSLHKSNCKRDLPSKQLGTTEYTTSWVLYQENIRHFWSPIPSDSQNGTANCKLLSSLHFFIAI